MHTLEELINAANAAFNAAHANGELAHLGLPERGDLNGQHDLGQLVWAARSTSDVAIYRGRHCYYVIGDANGLCGTDLPLVFPVRPAAPAVYVEAKWSDTSSPSYAAALFTPWP